MPQEVRSPLTRTAADACTKHAVRGRSTRTYIRSLSRHHHAGTPVPITVCGVDAHARTPRRITTGLCSVRRAWPWSSCGTRTHHGMGPWPPRTCTCVQVVLRDLPGVLDRRMPSAISSQAVWDAAAACHALLLIVDAKRAVSGAEPRASVRRRCNTYAASTPE